MRASFISPFDEGSEESTFVRALNDDIVAVNAQHGGSLRIHCECGRRGCVTALQITADEYRAVRDRDTRFLMAAGHERTVQRVILRYGAVGVVQPD